MKKAVSLLFIFFFLTGCSKIKEYFGFVENSQDFDFPKKTLTQPQENLLEKNKGDIQKKLGFLEKEKNLESPSFLEKGVKELPKTQEILKQDYKNLFLLTKKEKKVVKKPIKRPAKKPVKKPIVKRKKINPLARYVLEKKGEDYWLWIKKMPTTQSVALVIDYRGQNQDTKYFLRSLLPIKNQKNNQIAYQNKMLGNNQKLYFIASSALVRHPVLRQSFKLIIPKKVGLGYIKENSYSELDLTPHKTQFFIRHFSKKWGQGPYQDTLFTLPVLKTKWLIINKNSPVIKEVK